MREIKFRAWDPVKERMDYFDLDTYDKNEHDVYGTLEQYTGLKDNTGRDIYEGDKVYLAGYGILIVEDFGFELWDSVKSGNSDDIGEIIGNIHQ